MGTNNQVNTNERDRQMSKENFSQQQSELNKWTGGNKEGDKKVTERSLGVSSQRKGIANPVQGRSRMLWAASKSPSIY